MTTRPETGLGGYRPDEFPVSASALLFDADGRLLILRPTYKSGWTLPGGGMDASGESPWDACRREVREEVGLEVNSGRLVALDTRPGKDGAKLGLRFLFDCGTLSHSEISAIRLQRSEIAEHRFVERDVALTLLRKAIRRRVSHGWGAQATVYLENGRRVEGIT